MRQDHLVNDQKHIFRKKEKTDQIFVIFLCVETA